MSYLDSLVAAYLSTLPADDDTPLEVLRAELISAVDPEQRGRLLGLIARRIALSLSKQDSSIVPTGVPRSRPTSVRRA